MENKKFYDVYQFKSTHHSFSWCNGLYVKLEEDDFTYKLCKYDVDKDELHTFRDGRCIVDCTIKENKGLKLTSLKYVGTNLKW